MLMGITKCMISFILTFVTLFLLSLIPFSLSPPPLTLAGKGLAHSNSTSTLPKFAYLISGSKGDLQRLKRTLRALYHPLNFYLLHLDLEAPTHEREKLAEHISKDPVFAEVRNVEVVEKANLVTYRGPTMLANTLHAISRLLRTANWDWFINLSASDYPLLTQDDLIHAFSKLPRDLNFIQHTSSLGWKFNKRAKPIVIDPGLYKVKKSEIIWTSQQREIPTAFKLFTGSAWVMLSRAFAEYCILGYENLPRTTLLYYTNFISSPEGYFQTVICNSHGFKNTTVNHDLHYIAWDNPPKQHPIALTNLDYRRMVKSYAPFARKFRRNEPVLDRIDRDLLKRKANQFPYGGWCAMDEDGNKPCSEFRGKILIKPGFGSRRLRALLTRALSKRNMGRRQCK
ncbi:hypothetical protein AMTRI_Chr03g55780 [Amborella trichopoda]